MLNEPGREALVSGSAPAAEAARQALNGLIERRVPERIRDRDHTVWRPEPREIADRLGWLDAGDFLRSHLGGLRAFVAQVRDEGYEHVVLLGMGGSCLGPEVLRRALGCATGHPSLTVLDSTVPERVAAVAEAIDPVRTLFIVSSKSGGTIETLSFYRFFRDLVETSLADAAGRNFVAITDEGTPLQRLAGEADFRRAFLNPADIGGRYSVLSWFGMLPAALAGLDVERLLRSAASMRDRCVQADPDSNAESNPGLRLGALLGAATLAGWDKVTLVTPPPLKDLGLWVEQMIAESLGKEGCGIIPVAGEPLLPPDSYGADRLFVFLQTGRAAPDVERRVDLLEAAGHPVLRLQADGGYDLGAEFFRWEYATAVAGYLLDVHPFDQPDVQGAKDNTDRLLDYYLQRGGLPQHPSSGSIASLLDQARPGDYLAVIHYVPEDPEFDRLLRELRGRVASRCGVATTSGYGPRYLHSTGQLHKGGPGSGLYLHLTMNSRRDFPIPGQSYGFRTLAAAQAAGDFEALRNLDRRVITIDLGDDPVVGLTRLLDEL